MASRDKLIEKNRLESFSDGVIAIIITIMVLELRPPAGTQLSDLLPLLPVLLAYLLSFVYLAIYWNNHHHMLKATKGINGSIMWANMGLLFCLTLIPFATGWMGENYQATIPTAVYGAVLLASGLAYLILQQRIVATMGSHSEFAQALGADYKGKLSLIIYSASVGLAFVSPPLAQILFVVVALMWLVPDKRIERIISR